MSETTAVMTTGPGADVRAYVAQVREQLADLPSEDVDDLTVKGHWDFPVGGQ